MDSIAVEVLVVCLVFAAAWWMLWKVDQSNEPKVIPTPMDYCHWCDKLIYEEGRIQRPCPNCNDTAVYHQECGVKLLNKEPRCRGIYVAHKSGHIYSLKNLEKCARCRVDKALWEVPCGVKQKNSTFSASDEVLLRKMGVAVTEVEEES